jgi:serine/threonine protein kinase
MFFPINPAEYVGPVDGGDDDDGGGDEDDDGGDDDDGGGDEDDDGGITPPPPDGEPSGSGSGTEVLAVLVLIPLAGLVFFLYRRRNRNPDDKKIGGNSWNTSSTQAPTQPPSGQNSGVSASSPFSRAASGFARIGSFGRSGNSGNSKKGHTNPNALLNFMETTEGQDRSRGVSPPSPGGTHTIIDTANIKEADYAVNFSDLKLEKPIASGAGGSVYVGTYCGKKCAIKELHVAFGTSNTHLELMKREATLLAKLRHPNLVYFWGFCLDSSRFYIVMEFCPISVEDRLKAGYKFEGGELLRALRQFQEALQYLHQHNVLHRDLKPANVMFDEEGNLKVIDFGLARETTTGASMANFTQAVGSTSILPPPPPPLRWSKPPPCLSFSLFSSSSSSHWTVAPFYMAPEVFDNVGMGGKPDAKKVTYGRAADVYSWGIIAWQFVTGKVSPYEDQMQVRDGSTAPLPPPPPPTHTPPPFPIYPPFFPLPTVISTNHH